MRLAWFLVLSLLAGSAGAAPLKIDTSRARRLEHWKPLIAAYSLRHYGENSWQLEPRCIVLHYTAGSAFPWNLVKDESFSGETPGLASHYVVDGDKVWEILPPTVRSRGAYGINHRAINIEMVGNDASDLAGRHRTMDTCSLLVMELMQRFHLPPSEIYSHEVVSKMNPSLCRWVKDLVNPEPYGKSDPGEQNMRYILDRVRKAPPGGDDL